MAYATPEQRKSWSADDYEARLRELRDDFASLSEKDRTSDEYSKAKKALLSEREDLDYEYRIVRALSGAELPIERERRAQMNPTFSVPGSADTRSAGELVVDGWKEWMARGRSGDSPRVELHGRYTDQWRQDWETGYEARALVDSASSANLLRPVMTPTLRPQNTYQDQLYIRDLLPSGQTTFSAIPYLMEKNAAANQGAATTVAEGAVKPEATIEFDDETALVQVIAVTIPITNQMFEDTPMVVSYINSRLSYMLKVCEEDQLLNGNGTSPNLKGILSYTDVQEQDYVTDEIAVTVLNAAAKIRAVSGNPTGVVMHPNDYVSMISHRASDSGVFDAAVAGYGAPFSGVPATVWGIPVVQTAQMDEGTALVGDFRLGAQIWDRSGVEIRSFEQHADFAARNKRLIRAEERLALTVYRPDFFVVATVAGA